MGKDTVSHQRKTIKNIAILNIYAPYTMVTKSIKETPLQLKITYHGDFNTLLLPIDRSYRDKPNREMLELYDVVNQMDSADIYRTFHPNIKEFTFFLAPHWTVYKTVSMYSEPEYISKDTREVNDTLQPIWPPGTIFEYQQP